MVRALHSYREKISALSSLVDLRRTVPTHARRSQQLFKEKYISPLSPQVDTSHAPIIYIVCIYIFQYMKI